MTMPENDTLDGTQTPPPEQTQQPPASTPQDTGATTDFRFGDDAPEYLRGKSPQETVAWVTNLVNEVQQLLANPPAAAASQPQVNMQQYQQQQIALPDPDLALTDPKAYQAQLTNYLSMQNQVMLQQAAAPVYNQLATTARALSKADPANKDIWDKYSADVEAMVANVPPQLRTKELYDQAVVHVRGRRFDELAAEKAATLAAAGTGLARAGSAAGTDMDDSGDGDVWAKIEATPMGAAALKVAGKKGILNAIRAGAYKDLNAYAEAAAKSKAKVDPANPNIVRDYVRR